MRLLNRLTRIALLLLAATVMTTYGMGSAQASSYWSSVSQGLGDGHVWQDSNVNVLTPQQINTLKDQINATGKPIYLAVVDQAKAGSATSDYPSKLRDATGHNGVMVVVGAKTFKAEGFQTSPEVADQSPKAATAVGKDAKARGTKGPDYETVVNFINDITGLDWTVRANNSSNTSNQANADTTSSSNTWIWWTLGGLLVLVALGIALWLNLRDKHEDYDGNLPPMAREDHTGYADDQGDELPHYNPAPYAGSPERQHSTRQPRDRGLNDYQEYHSPTRTTIHNHYYPGGGGYPSGYYSPDFASLYLMSSLLNNGGDYGQGYRDAERRDDRVDAQSSGSSSDNDDDNTAQAFDSGTSGGSDWANNDGGGYGSDNSPTDFGGGSDSGGGFDSGGGSDSGGAGGTDW